MGYQPIYRAGQTSGKSDRECASRYDVIREAANRYSRPITVLDIGASEGYFSFRIAEDFPEATCIAIEGGPQLLPLCPGNSPIIHFWRRVSVKDLQDLATCEHFDVVLALNVLHHFADWQGAANAVLKLGETIIVETPPPGDKGACGQQAIPGLFEMFSGCGKKIAETQSHTAEVMRPMFLVERSKSKLTRSYIDIPHHAPQRDIHVKSSYSRKTANLHGAEEDWIPGINLRTYQRLGGVWPSAENVAQMVDNTPVPTEHHGDIRPWNFILSRDALHLIDGGDKVAIYDDNEGLKLTAIEIREMV